LNKIFLMLKKEFEEYKKNIEELLKIDYKYCNLKINQNDLYDIIDKLKNEKLNTSRKQEIIIHYNGNPYLTLNLSILAFLTKTTMYLEFDENMLGTNTCIVKIVNEVLEKFQTERLLHILKRNSPINENASKIICIDDINKYNAYLFEKNEKVKFLSLNYIDFYNESDEFEDLAELIYEYAENNLISIESYSEFEVDEAVDLIKDGAGEKIIVLTDNEETKEKFQKNIKNKKIYINQNPFDKEIKLIYQDVLL